jgi:hypothetical protein
MKQLDLYIAVSTASMVHFLGLFNELIQCIILVCTLIYTLIKCANQIEIYLFNKQKRKDNARNSK